MVSWFPLRGYVMAKHEMYSSEDVRTLVTPVSRTAAAQAQELLVRVYGLLGQEPPTNLTKALRRARSGLLTVEILVDLRTEQREGRNAQLRRLQTQLQNLEFKNRMTLEGRDKLQKDLADVSRRRKALKKSIKTNESAERSTNHRLTKTRKLINRVKSEIDARRPEPADQSTA